MDVNGTRFHLIQGQADWAECQEAGKAAWENAYWSGETGSVMLSPLLSLFPRGARDVPLTPAVRRGAAADKFGNWYWISQDQQQIYWLPSGKGKAEVYWSQTAVATAPAPGAFAPAQPPAPAIDTLSGLAVTTHHYLVVGSLTRRGLYLFDLHAGGAPTLLLWPQDAPFAPFDMAAREGGGLWILDRRHRAYWGLDRFFRVIGEPAHLSPLESPPPEETLPAFQPVGGTAVVCPGRAFPHGFPVAAPDPISIVALPGDQVLILDNPPPATSHAANLYHYALAELLALPLPLADEVEVATVGQTTTSHQLAVLGADMAYTAHNQTLYVVERDGNQVVAFHLDLETDPPTLTVRRDYLPLHFFGGRALATSMGSDTQPAQVYYDVVGRPTDKDAATRWVALQTIRQPRYTRTATLETAVFDGKERDCVWHRLFLEACIPADTAVTLSTRAHNDPDLLATVSYSPEPTLYRRDNGPELPYYQPFTPDDPLAEGQGTWELLMQAANGRYLQIKIELHGNGRVTPQLHALRAYYPRFSYPGQFLPAVYQQESSFLERLLANMEGIFTETEGKMVDVSRLFDARSAPPETLDWLAGWLGLMLDPLWAQVQSKRNGSHTLAQPAPDRRRLFIRCARILYEQRGTVDGLRFALHLFLDPCLEATLRAFKHAAITPTSTLPQRLARYNLAAPTPTTSETGLEDLLYAFVLARPSKIRIVEQYQTRGGRALVAGDPTETPSDAYAHWFTVLIPAGLPAAEEAMVNRIINLEKPAHTAFVLRRYWDGFRIGEARLGIDTTVDESSRFTPFILGRNTLAAGYLGAAHPFNVRERYVSDRDNLGNLPPL
ncbi:MAG: hypothetical protein H6659_07320 [Ardenticatenaceae bacterium]|nr:hypothetical protein [Ardenticatenaceae bacterium]